jgi:hypothetical protein
MVLTVNDDVGVVYFQIWKVWLCEMKNRGWLVMMLGSTVFRVQCAFPNMEAFVQGAGSLSKYRK